MTLGRQETFNIVNQAQKTLLNRDKGNTAISQEVKIYQEIVTAISQEVMIYQEILKTIDLHNPHRHTQLCEVGKINLCVYSCQRMVAGFH